MDVFLIVFSFFAIPGVAVAFFIISLCRFLSMRKKAKVQPDNVNMQKLKTRKIIMIISSIIAGVFVIVVVTFCVVFTLAIIYM